MGVTNLWTLLEPCGRRVDVQALRGRRVAVDASGWIFRFIKAMRDDQGELIPNAHLIGFFRRICKLLFYNIRPVFVFDGSTPALKRRTVAERRRAREQQEARVRKTAERLLLNRLKQHVLTTMEKIQTGANGKEGSTTAKQGNKGKVKKSVDDDSNPDQTQADNNNAQTEGGPSTTGAAPVVQSGDGTQATANENAAGNEIVAVDGESSSDSEDIDFEPLLPEGEEEVDPMVLATLPPSMQLEVMMRLRDRRTTANRSGFEQRTGKPESFSQYQMEQYLRSSNLRRQLEIIRGNSASGADAARPIAAEEGREYILTADDDERQQQQNGNDEITAAGGSGSGSQQQPQSQSLRPGSGSAPAEQEKAINVSFTIKPDEILSDDSMEWEDVDPDINTNSSPVEGGNDGSGGKLHWRERAAQRHKYWSLSHGFQMGRQLGKWGEEENEEEGPAGNKTHRDGNGEGADDDDAQLQEAIRQSLMTTNADTTTITAQRSSHQQKQEQQQQHQNENDDVDFEDLSEPQKEQQPERAETEIQRQAVAEEKAIDGEMLKATEEPIVATEKEEEVIVVKHKQKVEVSRPKVVDYDFSGAASSPGQVPAVEKILGSNTGMLLEPVVGEKDSATPERTKVVKKSVKFAVPEATKTVLIEKEPSQAAVEVQKETSLTTTAMESIKPNADTNDDLIKSKQQVDDEEVPDLNANNNAAITTTTNISVPLQQQEQAPIVEGPSKSTTPHPVSLQKSAIPNPSEQPQTTIPDTSLNDNFNHLSEFNDQFSYRGSEMQFNAEDLYREEATLRSERRAAAGQSDTPTDQMYTECQELLQLFGLPYIIAPSEAEAQCAWLDSVGLVDGVVTDDNDAFLFGAKRVYRHIFEGAKYVEEYRSAEVETELGLGRDRLISLALLLGSDYTPGVKGVGVVNAVEIVHAFQGVDGLERFAKWVKSVDEEIIALAKKAAAGGSEDGGEPTTEQADADAENEAEATYKSEHRNVRKGWTLPSGFPSAEVFEAYTDPKIDSAKDKFVFARPDLELLRRFCSDRFGWDSGRTDELLIPVLKAYDERQTQQTLDNFVAYRQRFAKIRSKRLQKAVSGIAGGNKEELMMADDEDGEEGGEDGKAKGRKKKKTSATNPSADDGGDGGEGSSKKPQKGRKRKAAAKELPPSDNNNEDGRDDRDPVLEKEVEEEMEIEIVSTKEPSAAQGRRRSRRYQQAQKEKAAEQQKNAAEQN